MEDDGMRIFSRAFKLTVIERMDAGENVSALSRELGIKGEISVNKTSSSRDWAR